MSGATIDTCDHVLHKPSGETWVVAMVQGDDLTCCGWPETIARVSDCELVQKATPEARDTLLRDMARSDGRRGSYARHRIAQQSSGQQEPQR